MSLKDTYQTRKNLLAQNLTAMGVTASGSEGLTSLIDKVTDIAPSVGGITPTVSIDLSKSPTLICRGATVDIMALVHADYDDTSQTDVDLKGYLQGATVTFKNGNDSIGYAVSDNDGIATLTINDIAMGNYSIVGSFDGTGTDYESATSSAMTFTVNDYPTLVLSADKTTVNVGETVTFTITAEYNNTPVVGYPIQLYKDGSSMGSLYAGITNNNGECTISYTTVTGDNNCSINANTLSNSITLEVATIVWYDPCLPDDNRSSEYTNYGGQPTLDITTDGMAIKTSTGERWLNIPIEISSSTDFTLTYTYMEMGRYIANCIEIRDASTRKFGVYNDVGRWKDFTGAVFSQQSFSTGDIITFKRSNGTITVKVNDNTIGTFNNNTDSGYISFETLNDGRWTRHKDITLAIL